MTTVADAIEQTVDLLYGGYRPTINRLTTTVDADDTEIVVDYTPDTITPRSYISIDDELMWVAAVDQSAKSLDVIRAQRGSVAAAHTAGATVEFNPRFPRYRIKRALKDEIRGWPENLYRVDTADLSTSVAADGYDLTGINSDFYAILDVQLGPAGTRQDWVRVGYQIVRDPDLVTFASGAGLILTGYYGESRDLRVVVARPFDVSTFNDDTVLETTVGLPSTAVDIPPMGAAYRLMMGRDVQRSFGEGQGEPRKSEEVPFGAAASTATYLMRQRDKRLSEEAARLLTRHPIRM